METPEAWLTVAATFVVGFVVFGISYSFGAFFDPMMASLDVSRASVSTLSSVCGLLFYLAGPVAGHLGDRFGPRPLIAVGGSTGLISDIRVGYLTYGTGVAGGLACAYAPSLARFTAIILLCVALGCAGSAVLLPLRPT
ncbi:MAG TPA: MFS transporter [Rhodopila sp.]|nr:MFS transporter [Rhodopila sp.]